MCEMYKGRKYLYLGHSFCRKLQNWCRHGAYVNMGLHHAEVVFAGRLDDNRNITYINHGVNYVETHAKEMAEYDLCCLEFATNDILSKFSYLEPVKSAEKVFNLARRIRGYGCKRVVINQVIFRKGDGAVPRWAPEPQDWREVRDAQTIFNDAVKAYNRHLSFLCKRGDGTIVFNRVRGVHRRWDQFLGLDGVHYNPRGMEVYYHAMRAMIIRQGLIAMN